MINHQYDYAKLDYEYQRHHERYKNRVEQEGLICQDCGGSGEHYEDRIEHYTITSPCGWCEGTGKITKWLRGLWLAEKRREKNAITEVV